MGVIPCSSRFCEHPRIPRATAPGWGQTVQWIRTSRLVGLVVMNLVVGGATTWAQDRAVLLTVDEAVATALRDNPGLRALRLARGIAASDIQIARQRPNPDVLYEGTRETPHHALTLSLPIETAGKRGRREGVAQAAAQTTDAGIAAAEADIRASTRRAFYALLVAQLRSTVAQDLLGIGTRATGVAEARVQAGDAARLELVQADLARARLENDAAAVAAEAEATRVELNGIMGRAPSMPMTLAGSVEPDDIGSVLARVTAPATTNPDVVVVDRRLVEARARVELAKALRVPDPIAQATLTYKAPPDFTYGWRVGASVTMPLFHRSTAVLGREQRSLDQAMATKDATILSTEARAVAAAARLKGLWDQRRRETTVLVPRSQEVASMAEEAYRAGQIDLTALLQVLQTSRDVQLRTLDTALALQLAIADVERATGVEQ